MGGQVPVMAFLAITWLPRVPGLTLLVLALQAAAVVANLAAVSFYNL